MSKAPFILLVNPWITDFAAFDLWAKPLGLLHLASLLREGGCGVALMDCMDRHDAATMEKRDMEPGVDRKYGTGKYPKTSVPKPRAYAGIPRNYYRYGIHPESLLARLNSLPRPDLIWVTSMMTYWYPGVQQTIAALRTVFGQTPVWLGGIYASLCPEHARRHSGATEVVTIPASSLPEKVASATGFTLNNRARWGCFEEWPSPALDLISRPVYAPILTSVGCPFHCPYCASRTLQPRRARRNSERIRSEIVQWHRRCGIVDFAFYDDALLMDGDNNLRAALESLCREGLGLRFHTPNGLHIRAITEDWAQLLHASGFATIRLGLETTKPAHHKKWGGKVENEMFFSAVSRLRTAGFNASRIGVYLLAGLPGQTPEEVASAIEAVRQTGAAPYVAEYSPVPGTAMWDEAVAACPYDLQGEPLFHNNTFFACRRPGFTYEDLVALKDLARVTRHSVDSLDGNKRR